MLKGILNLFKKENWRQHSARLVIHKEVTNYAQTLRNNFTTLAISIIGVATAISWSSVVQTVLTDLFPNTSDLMSKMYVAIVITLVSITLTYLITRFTKRNQQ